MTIPFTPLVASLPAAVPFVGPETIERQTGRTFRARLGANESAFGMSPKAKAAVQAELEWASWYGDPENYDLRHALAAKHGVGMENIMVGEGVDAILGYTVRMIAGPGIPVVTSLGAYPTFNYHVAGYGSDLVTVPYSDDHEDPDALLAKVQETKSPLMYFANPDNPMGTWHDGNRVQALIDAVPDGCLLVLDEAYIDFAPDGSSPPIDASNPRAIVMRTFSKAHGMAGMRVGYAVGHQDLITGLGKVRNHFAMNRLSQVAALASLHDTEFLSWVISEVETGRQETYALADRLGLRALESATNFVAIDLGSKDRAAAVLQGLAGRGVFIRMPGVTPLNRCIRVSIGRPDERAIFAEAFEEALQTL